MRCKAYLTDEGFGPLVRFAAVLEQLRRRLPDFDVEVQTFNHVEIFPSLAERVSLSRRHNLIRWHRHDDGRPDLAAIRDYYDAFEAASREFVEDDLATGDPPDFVISDFVYDAFEIAARRGVPSFGFAHFTWDWFFGKLYPNPIPAAVLARWRGQADLATCLFFPPFTPAEILAHHSNAVPIPLVVRATEPAELPRDISEHFKILVVDSGSQVLREDLRRALGPARPEAGRRFFVREGLVEGPAHDVVVVPAAQRLIDLIPHMDLVIGRAGFNTISECLAARVPMLLLGEAMNPEMAENIIAMKARNLASFVDIKALSADFAGTLDRFLAGEFQTIRQQVSAHTIGLDGADAAAEAIAAIVESGRRSCV